MEQFSLSPMQKHEITMRQMVEQIHLGKLNLDQAAVQFEVHRKTVRHWVNKVEQEAEINKKAAPEPPPGQPSNRKKTSDSHSSQEANNENNELRAKVRVLEQELEIAQYKALYYSTLIKVTEQELGIDIEKKSATKPSDSY
jgi:transposase